MKRLGILTLLILLVLSGFFAWNNNQAEATAIEFFNSGDLVITSRAIPQLDIFDASNDYTQTDIGVGTTEMNFTLIDENGNIIGPSSGTLRCRLAPDYTQSCSGFNYALGTVNYYDPTNIGGGVQGTVDLSLEGFIFSGAIDPFGGIWMTHWDAHDGQYISRTYAENGSLTTVAYDVDYGDTPNKGPASIVIDHLGDIWFTKPADNTNGTDTNVYCLDRSNDFAVCSGASFGSVGEIGVGTRPYDLVVDHNNDIFTVNASSHTVTKVDRDSQFGSTFTTSTSVGLNTLGDQVIYPIGINVDGAGRVWVVGFDTLPSANAYVLKCLNGDDLGETGTGNSQCGSSGVYKTITTAGTIDAASRPGVDVNNDIWVIDNTDDRVHCYDSSNSYNACTGPNFTSGYLTATDIRPEAGIYGDIFGERLAYLINAIGAQDDADIYATVDPTISMTISSTLCELGTLSTSSISGCGFTVTYTSNATGVTPTIKNVNPGSEDGMVSSNGDVIEMLNGTCSNVTYTDANDCVNNGATWTYPYLTAGSEGSGWAIQTFDADNGGLPSTACSDPQYQTEADCTGNGETWTASACPGNGSAQTLGSEAFDPSNGALANPAIWSILGKTVSLDYCFSAAISSSTPAGSYQHSALFTLTGTF